MILFYVILILFSCSFVSMENSHQITSNNNTVNVNNTTNITKTKQDKNGSYVIETEGGPVKEDSISKTFVHTNIEKPKVSETTEGDHKELGVHRGRENVIDEVRNTKTGMQDNINSNLTINKLTDDHISEKNDHKNSKPRKGADFNESNNTDTDYGKATKISSTTTTTTKPKKPTVTVGGDDSILNSQSSKDETNNANIETYTVNSHKSSSNFVVPIVAVILSVPLVAIVISVLYKRGSEWWQHRHYSRMDFLIDGMYNS